MVSETSNADRTNERAPKYLVPDQIAMTVEHPCIIKNFDKAYSMIGGPPAIARSFKAGPGPEAALNLRFEPDDPTDRPIASMPRSANNILLAVTVPKRTGRKRKRGSDGPFLENLNDQPPAKDAQYLLRSLQDNPNSYSLEPLANISSTHVWRTMPDFVYSTAHSEFINELREKVLPMSYPLMKQYTLPQTYGLTNTEVIPPPQLSSARIPTNYSYRSNPYMPLRTSPTTNHQTLYSRTAARKTQLISVHWSSPFPTTPPATPPPPSIEPLITTLRTLFTTRPIWTRRALTNQLPPNIYIPTLRAALAHVAFTIRSGPWRDTLCAIGTDPRTSPDYRIYQTITIQLTNNKLASAAATATESTPINLDLDSGNDSSSSSPDSTTTPNPTSTPFNPTSHIFTGPGHGPLPSPNSSGSTWQILDIHDPLLLPYLTSLPPSVISPQCEPHHRGYYPAAAWCKLKFAMKARIEGMLGSANGPGSGSGRGNERAIRRLLALPDVWDGEGEVGYDDFQYGQGQGQGEEEEDVGIGEETRRKEGHWVVLWRASVRGMIVVEEREMAKRKEREEGEMVEGGSGSGSGSVETPDLGDVGEVLEGDGDGDGFLDEEREGEGEGELEGEEADRDEDEDVDVDVDE